MKSQAATTRPAIAVEPRTERHVAAGTVAHTGALSARTALLLIVVVYLLLATIWSLVIPLGEGPDEAAHFNYALFLARTGHLPVQSARGGDVPGEGHQPPLAYWLMQPAVRWLPDSELEPQALSNPDFIWAGGKEASAYLHGVREQFPYHGQILAWHLARGLSVLLGVVTVICCWATARTVWPRSAAPAVGAAALVAVNPQFIFQQALVSNDPALIALSSVLIYGCVRLVVRAPWQVPGMSARAVILQQFREDWCFPAVLGVLLGALLITKQSAIALAPLPFIAAALRRPRGMGPLLRRSIAIGLPTVAIAGWWYLRNRRLYGDLFGLAVFQQTFATSDVQLTSLAGWRVAGWNLLRSSWGLFGWQTIAVPDGAYWLFAAALGLASLGLLQSLATPASTTRRASLILLLATAAVAGWTVAFARTAGLVGWQGRFLFPALVPLSIGLARGLDAILPRRAGSVGLAVSSLALALMLPWTVIRPAYPIAGQTQGHVPVTQFYAAFERGAQRRLELRAASYPSSVVTGTRLPVDITWHAVAPLDRPWWLFVHLVDAHGKVVTGFDGPPLAGRVPVNKWVPGDWFADHVVVDLKPVPPGVYTVRLGLWDPKTNDRLGVYNEQRELQGDYVVLGPLTITAR